MDLALVALGRKSPPSWALWVRERVAEPSIRGILPQAKQVCEVVLGLGVLGVGLLLGRGRRGVGFLGWGRLWLCRRRADDRERHHRARNKRRGPNVEPHGAHFLGSGVSLVGMGNWAGVVGFGDVHPASLVLSENPAVRSEDRARDLLMGWFWLLRHRWRWGFGSRRLKGILGLLRRVCGLWAWGRTLGLGWLSLGGFFFQSEPVGVPVH